MKRSMGGGAHRGPVAPTRQRRTIRFVQILLLLTAAGLLMFAGYSWGLVNGYEDGTRAGAIDAPREPSPWQPVVLVVLGGIAIRGAFALQDSSGVRMPTPARLDDLAGRAEHAAIQRAEEAATTSRESG